MQEIIKNAITSHKEALSQLEHSLLPVIEEIASLCVMTLKNNGKIAFIGNGGSAADAQHLAAELVGRFKINRIALPAIALTTDTSIITAIGNDFAFEEIFLRQVEALLTPSDLLIAISTSGKSKNIITAVNAAKNRGIKTVGLLGRDGGQLQSIVDLALTIKNNQTPAIQEMHILAGHIICEIIEKAFIK